MKRLLYAVLILAMLMSVFAVTAYAAKDKVDVCHVRGNGMVGLITIALNALPAHLAHGDFLPNEAGECNVEPPGSPVKVEVDPQCYYDNPPEGLDIGWAFTLTSTEPTQIWFKVFNDAGDIYIPSSNPFTVDGTLDMNPDLETKTFEIYGPPGPEGGELWLTVERPCDT